MTSAATESQIEDTARRLQRRGYDEVIVYRNSLDVALAELALQRVPLTQKFNMAVSAGRGWCVIGVRNDEDRWKIRKQVQQYQKALGLR